MSVIHGIVGCGRVMPNHVDGIRRAPDATLAWICDRDASALERAAEMIPEARPTTDWQEVFDDPAVDSVSIAVDHAQHAPLAEAALLRGKHVLVEKPLSHDLGQGTSLVQTAARCGRLLSVVSQHRYDPLVVGLRRLVGDGMLGQVLGIEARLHARREPEYFTDSSWRGTWEHEGGSALINQGYHYVDLMVWLGGRAVAHSAHMSNLRLRETIETDESFSGLIRFEGGVLGTIFVTISSAQIWRSRVDVTGTEGSVSFDLDHPNRIHTARVAPRWEKALEELEECVAGESEEPPPGVDYYGISHRRQIQEFVAAVAGEAELSADGAVGLETLRVIDALYESAGRPAGRLARS